MFIAPPAKMITSPLESDLVTFERRKDYWSNRTINISSLRDETSFELDHADETSALPASSFSFTRTKKSSIAALMRRCNAEFSRASPISATPG